MSADKALACPRCGQADGLATIEELVGVAQATFYPDDLVWNGSTDVDWNSSTTVGLCCGCGWFHDGADWSDVLQAGGDDQG